LLRSIWIHVFMIVHRDKKVVGVFVRFFVRPTSLGE
jgi:hypothetical protein